MLIKEVQATQNDIQAMVKLSDKANRDLYPDGPNYLESPEKLKLNSTMFGLYQMDELIGMGALKWCEGYAEVKRLFIHPDHRGKGLSKYIMEEIEKRAKSNSVNLLRLETGQRQPAAIGLYESLGYKKIKAFNGYQEDPMSVFLEKTL